nr:aspartate/glutamate racemase family protein [Halomonas organivorans]
MGILGGVGWPSTIEYYRLVCEASLAYHRGREFSGPTPMPEIVIESLDMNFTINNRGTSEPGSWDVWDAYFHRALRRLEASGAELIVIASVTPHARLKEISHGIGVPVLSVYEAIGRQCAAQGIEKLLVLGTLPTMTSPAFRAGMAPFGVDAVAPSRQALKDDVAGIIGKLYRNEVEGAAEAIERVVRAAVPEQELAGLAVCLGCTELPLAFPEHNGEPDFLANGIRYLNSSVMHATAAFQACVDTP